MLDFYDRSKSEISNSENVIFEQSPLSLDIEDYIFTDIIDQRISASKTWYTKERNLYERRKRNRAYLLGDQLPERDYKKYNVRYMDNVIYEAEASIKPIALSRLPDLLVKPGSDSEDSKKSAKSLSIILNNDIRQRENRRVLAMAFKHHPLFYIGVIKYVWDPSDGENGNYKFVNVHPDNIQIDHTARTLNVKDMGYVAEDTEMTVKECMKKWPKKSDELLEALGYDDDDRRSESKLASLIKIKEVWFQWYDKSGNKVNGVAWKYNTVVLGKMKNPNYDYEGSVEYLDEMGNKIDEQTFRSALAKSFVSGAPMPQFKVIRKFANYFNEPEFPYIFIGYDQYGEMPLDETSRIEQVIYLQDNVNKQGRQFTEMVDRARGIHVFSTDSGLDKAAIQKLDMSNPESDLLVNGDVTKVHGYFKGDIPDASIPTERANNKAAIFSKMGTHDTTRGVKDTDVGITSQLLREADYGRIDDLVEDTINDAAEKMARAAMQMIKLRYTEEHFVKCVGRDGSTTFERVSRDLIEDGVEVVVHASGTDKMLRKRIASEMATNKMIDPLTYYEDMEVSNPKERAERLMAFSLTPELYYQKYVMGQTTPMMANTLVNGAQGGLNPQMGGESSGGGEPNADIAANPQPATVSAGPGGSAVGV